MLEQEGGHLLSGTGHVWARHDLSFQGDQRISFRLKLLQDRVHLIVRLTDSSRYYIGFADDGSYLSKQYFPTDFRENLAVYTRAHNLSRWVEVVILLQGSRIDFFVDGTLEWSYTDPQPLLSGSLAFETLDSSRAQVDDICIETASSLAATATRLVATATQPSVSTPGWIRLGGPIGGLGYDVRMRPEDPDVMFVTDANAGVFMSMDEGKNWFPSNQGITVRIGITGDAIPVFSLTIDPNDNNIVWVGTQNTRGIFKSIDGGRTWTRMDRGITEQDGITFRGFTVEPGNSDIVYAAGEIASWIWAGGDVRGVSSRWLRA